MYFNVMSSEVTDTCVCACVHTEPRQIKLSVGISYAQLSMRFSFHIVAVNSLLQPPCCDSCVSAQLRLLLPSQISGLWSLTGGRTPEFHGMSQWVCSAAVEARHQVRSRGANWNYYRLAPFITG